ncbi:hypothetical protein QVD17_38589 [Tagetes erecta]|uniref:Uncharacterized protein n=1 Tax=Tagetes erecta TaxID=13708 RepID=A0AAD8JP59_TARER|nr:hypothetical protein QVD17_38589 [Tagetes erecta]
MSQSSTQPEALEGTNQQPPEPPGGNTNNQPASVPPGPNAYLSSMTQEGAVIYTDSDEEEPRGVARKDEEITTDFVKQNKAAILTQLAELEKIERLNEVKQKLTFDQATPGTSNVPAPAVVDMPVTNPTTFIPSQGPHFQPPMFVPHPFHTQFPQFPPGVSPGVQYVFSPIQPLQTPAPAGVPVNPQANTVLSAGTSEDDLSKPYVPENLATESKFTRRIANFQFPTKLKMPNGIGKYSGSGDPDDHIHAFKGAAQVERWALPIWCHMFAQTFTGPARVWFDGLPTGEIDDFIQFKDRFLRAFHQQRKALKNPGEMLQIRRNDGETIPEYIERFNRESMNIPDVPEVMKVTSFIYGLRHNQLCGKLNARFPKTLDEVMDRARAYHRRKEAEDQMKEMEGRRNKHVRKDEKKEGPQTNRQRNERDNRKRTFSPYKAEGGGERRPWITKETFTPLLKTPAEVYALERKNNMFTTPTPLKNVNKNSRQYCDFHREKGHDTDDCIILKRQIEAAVKSGKLAHLVREIKKKGHEQGEETDQAEIRRPTVNMVDQVGNDTTMASRKRKGETLEAWMKAPITFESLEEWESQENPVTITVGIEGHAVRRVHLDGGSGSEVMYEHCFKQLDPEIRAKMQEGTYSLVSFSGEVVYPLGKITLPVVVGESQRRITINMTFAVVRARSAYNVIIGRPGIKALRAVVSTTHGVMKFPTPRGIATVRSSSELLVASILAKRPELVEDPDPIVEKWIINPRFPEQTVGVGRKLSADTKAKLKEIFLENVKVFAWQPSDMTGVPRRLAEHRLEVIPFSRPVKQKKRSMGPEKSRAVCEEVAKLVQAGIVREAKYPTWIANPVMVKKSDDTWRMCVDFKNINEACPKDSYPLPEIDKKIDALAGFPLRCFLDAYKGYHQIKMAKEDEEKTAFHTDAGTFCYTKMPFGLKNAGATYQHLMDDIFIKQAGKSIEVYVDDLVIKSRKEESMLEDISTTFKTLTQANMKLNPKKCTFGVEEGKFLGVMVTKSGIRPNPDKVEAVIQMASPKTRKEVQRLNGRLVSLNRFLSRMMDKSYQFINTMKNCIRKNDFIWTAEAEEAFQEMKKHLCTLPTLTSPEKGETLTLYLATTTHAISAALMADRGNAQMPVYFISRILKDEETRYPAIERLALALIYASRRLRRYFDDHPIQVVTEQPLQQVLKKPEVSGRLAKWAIELGTYRVTYKPRTAIKGQIIADFLTEISKEGEEVPPGQPPISKEQGSPEPGLKEWKLYTDGASNSEGSGIGLVLISPEGAEITHALRLNFRTSNNESEYEALIAGLRIAKQMKAQAVEAYVDSLLVANQINQIYEAKEPSMRAYLELVGAMTKQFKHFQVKHISRGQNKKADALSKLASVAFSHLAKEIRVEVLNEPSTGSKEVHSVTKEPATWMVPIIKYLTTGESPVKKEEAHALKQRAAYYEIINGELYRKSFLGPSMKCVDPDEGTYVVREIHEGICGSHAGPKSVVRKAMNAGYYWPAMYQTAVEVIQKCDSCQRQAPVSRRPAHLLIPVSSPWPFYKWGIDIVGPFPESTGKVKFLLVAIDYFSKWIEAKPLATITGQQIKKFAWENIVCRFGIPGIIVSDNGKQFAENPFKAWCDKLEIKQVFASVAHPQANGQVERANRSLVEGIKTRLGREKGSWAEELPHVLWAHRTMHKTSHGETPFSLVYGTEAMIPVEIGSKTPRTIPAEDAETDLRTNLNLLEERREIAAIREASYKKIMEKYYNTRVREVVFQPGQLVLRSNEASKAESQGKMGPRWEGPYRVTEASKTGAYTLERMDGTVLPRTWNAIHLKRYYM